jgi:hypothetical protein
MRHGPLPATSERCPWCGSKITHAKFLQIQDQMEQKIRERLATEVKAQQEVLIKQLAQEADKRIKKEIAEVRRVLQKDRESALLKKDAEFAREREALQKKVAEMSRRVQKRGGEVAEGGELDLYDELRSAFPDDVLTRTKGKAGETLLLDVRYKGKSAGKILIDATPRAAWQHLFVTRLRQDQSELGADHALLATPVFPAGKRELFMDSGVIVVAPARVRAMVEVLRKALIAMYVAKLSDAERSDKLGRLFRFITSAGFKKKLAEASDLANDALNIDVEEKRAHDLVWKKRGTVLMRIKNVLRDIDTDVSAIVEAPGPEPAGTALRPAAFRVTGR